LRTVSQEEYEKRKKAKTLWEQDKKSDRWYVYVTQEMFDKVYKKANQETPRLPEGEHLRLANTELLQSINPGFIILLTPVIVSFWSLLRRRGQEPSTPTKIGLGLLIIVGSPVIMLTANAVSDNGAFKVTAWWLFATYAVATVAELCLSPMGLALVNR